MTVYSDTMMNNYPSIAGFIWGDKQCSGYSWRVLSDSCPTRPEVQCEDPRTYCSEGPTVPDIYQGYPSDSWGFSGASSRGGTRDQTWISCI